MARLLTQTAVETAVPSGSIWYQLERIFKACWIVFCGWCCCTPFWMPEIYDDEDAWKEGCVVCLCGGDGCGDGHPCAAWLIIHPASIMDAPPPPRALSRLYAPHSDSDEDRWMRDSSDYDTDEGSYSGDDSDMSDDEGTIHLEEQRPGTGRSRASRARPGTGRSRISRAQSRHSHARPTSRGSRISRAHSSRHRRSRMSRRGTSRTSSGSDSDHTGRSSSSGEEDYSGSGSGSDSGGGSDAASDSFRHSKPRAISRPGRTRGSGGSSSHSGSRGGDKVSAARPPRRPGSSTHPRSAELSEAISEAEATSNRVKRHASRGARTPIPGSVDSDQD